MQDCILLWEAKQDQERCLRSGQPSPMPGNCWLGAWHSFDLCQVSRFSLTRSGLSSGVGVDRVPLPTNSRGCSYSSGGWRKLSRMGLSHARPRQVASGPKKTPICLLLYIQLPHTSVQTALAACNEISQSCLSLAPLFPVLLDFQHFEIAVCNTTKETSAV